LFTFFVCKCRAVALADLVLWRICNPPAPNISICNASHPIFFRFLGLKILILAAAELQIRPSAFYRHLSRPLLALPALADLQSASTEY